MLHLARERVDAERDPTLSLLCALNRLVSFFGSCACAQVNLAIHLEERKMVGPAVCAPRPASFLGFLVARVRRCA